jgi:hypothetical protein
MNVLDEGTSAPYSKPLTTCSVVDDDHDEQDEKLRLIYRHLPLQTMVWSVRHPPLRHPDHDGH